MKKHTTSINEKARHILDISRDEYALCDYIQFRLADPRGKSGGWCFDSKQEIAEFIGISRPGLYKMMDRMEKARLLEVDPPTGFSRVTGRWIDSISECKQSLQGGVNKVNTDCKQSLQACVNKVTLNKEEKDIEKEEGEGVRGTERFAPPAPAENKTSTVAEKIPLSPKVALKGSAPAAPFTEPRRVDTVDEAEEIIMEWATADGRESVRKWYSEAFRACTESDVKAMVSKFAGVYLTIGDEGKRQRMAQDPLQFFKYTFKSFLKNEKSHGVKNNFPVVGVTPSNIPASLQGLIGK